MELEEEIGWDAGAVSARGSCADVVVAARHGAGAFAQGAGAHIFGDTGSEGDLPGKTAVEGCEDGDGAAGGFGSNLGAASGAHAVGETHGAGFTHAPRPTGGL